MDETSESDRELVLQLQSGNLDALGTLFDRHRQLVFRTALAISGDSEAAADLLQDVFLRLHRFADKVDPNRPLEPWLYRVTANLTCTYVKRRRWMRPLGDIAEWLVGDSKNAPPKLVERTEEWEQVRKAIAGLQLSHRMVIVMYYINELKINEIAEILDVPIGTVKSRLYYGRQGLKNHLNVTTGVIPEVAYEFT